jgi:type II secretion system protein G
VKTGLKTAWGLWVLLPVAVGCGRQPAESPKSRPAAQRTAAPAASVPAPPPPDAARADPAEAKRLRLADILREVLKSRKEPAKDAARQAELKKLADEALSIARELVGDDEKKQAALAEEVTKRYLPEQFQEMQVARAKAQLANIAQALEMYYVDAARYPSTEMGLRVLADTSSARGPYLANDILKDPWGRDYLYRCPGTGGAGPYDLKSLGPDGQEGTADDVVK